jgi:hypothetical protein
VNSTRSSKSLDVAAFKPVGVELGGLHGSNSAASRMSVQPDVRGIVRVPVEIVVQQVYTGGVECFTVAEARVARVVRLVVAV